MHKAFIITGTREGKELNAVFFTDNDATPAFVHGLGIENIEIFQVAPKSDQPLTPALYLFNSTANETNITSVEIEIIAFDNSHQEMMRHKVQGAPHLLVPPVEGPKAQETLYAPTAHLIKGTVDGGTPVLAILIVKPEPGKPTLDPSPKVLKAMGITRISTFERVKYEENGIKETQLFVVERSPSANSVDVKTLGSSGKILSEKTWILLMNIVGACLTISMWLNGHSLSVRISPILHSMDFENTCKHIHSIVHGSN